MESGDKYLNREKKVWKLDKIEEGWQNKPDTAELKCDICSTWKNHWEKLYEQELSVKRKFDGQTCASNKNPNTKKPCTNDAEDGAHVVGFGKVWIAPLCSQCNHPTNTDFFPLKAGTVIVDARPCK